MTFPTEQQVYHRLRWDARFDVERCHIVISLRPTGEKRLPYLEYDPVRVPFHRILEFWVDDELAWSRPQRIDRLDVLAARHAPRDSGRVLDEVPGAPHRFDSHAARWIPGTLDASPPATTLRVVTWNLLFDRHDAERLHSDERWADALARLAQQDADVLVLVEITPKIWDRVLAQPWVRAAYAVSHGPDARLLVPYGQVVLARHPIVRASMIQLVRDRRVTLADVRVADRTFGIAALHLTSNRTEGAPALRAAQLAAVLGHVRATPRDGWIVAGDFNANPNEHAALLADAHATDAWDAARPDEPGATFDVIGNALAAAMSVTGRSGRYDRILAIGDALVARDAELFGREPGPSGLPPSDHYAVRAEFAITSPDLLATATPSKHTALVLVPPEELWGPIQRVRCEHDRGFGRWAPHLTLFYPFVEPRLLDAARDAIAELASALDPFELVLERVEPIEPGSRIVVLSPTRHTSRFVEQLRDRLADRFPSLAGARRFRPHLTLARDPTVRLPDTLPTRWIVDRITLLRERARRLVTAREVALAGVTLRAPAPAPDPVTPVCARIATTLAAAGVHDARIEPFGSSVYAPGHARDVDIAIQTSEVERASAALATGVALRRAGRSLRGRIDGTPVDVIVTPDDDPGPADARRLVEHLRDHGRHAAFLAAWPYVQRFARARGLVGNGLGYPPSLGWAILLAVPLCHDERACAAAGAAVIPAWLDWLGTLVDGSCVALDLTTCGRATLWIAAPASPPRNVARALTAGTARVVLAEFRRAARLATDPERAAIDLLDEPPPGTTLVVTGSEAARGPYEGAFRELLRALEAVTTVRPWGRFDTASERWQHRITVDDVTTASQITEAWLAQRGLDATCGVVHRLVPT
ncbi:MAG TPA: RNA repair domain-containing protein [Kofleriaceae bacterium]|nr:RNA repair domain-containing protein [Kofleriaceae bacterium]